MRFFRPRRLPAFLAALSLALLAVSPLSAQEAASLPAGAYLLPPRFHPGDVVELRIPVPSVVGNGKRELRPPSQAEEYEIRKILLESHAKGSTLSVFFIAWKPGSLGIEPFVAEGISFPGATVYAQTILEGDGDRIRPLRGLLFLPGTKTLVAMLVSGLAALILLSWAVAALLLPFVSRLLSLRRARRPYKRFQHETRIMRKRLDDRDRAYFYALLSKAFRAYASARLFPGFASITAGEFGKAAGMDEALVGLGTNRELVASILMRSDLVRFAGSGSRREERIEDMGALSRIVDSLEAERAGS